jgi:hypothetical protein
MGQGRMEGSKQKSATHWMVFIFSIIVGLVGMEHAVGEILQGDVVSDEMFIESWPDNELFRIMAGEPAMTIIPNMRMTGIIAVVMSLITGIWGVMFVDRKGGGYILILFSILLLFVGGGFGPPLIGIIVGAVATRINKPLKLWRRLLPASIRPLLARIWPWTLAASVLGFLTVFPGLILLGHFFGYDNSNIVPVLTLFNFVTLLGAIVCSYARDLIRMGEESQASAL